MVHRILRKLGIGGTVASLLMIMFGVLILWKPTLLNYLIASYLILVGLIRLIPEKD